MNKFIKKFSAYIKFCVFLVVMSIGVINMAPREVSAKSMNSIVGAMQN